LPLEVHISVIIAAAPSAAFESTFGRSHLPKIAQGVRQKRVRMLVTINDSLPLFEHLLLDRDVGSPVQGAELSDRENRAARQLAVCHSPVPDGYDAS
jgi:hypothetical protein